MLDREQDDKTTGKNRSETTAVGRLWAAPVGCRKSIVIETRG